MDSTPETFTLDPSEDLLARARDTRNMRRTREIAAQET